jgi:hypothetical protein
MKTKLKACIRSEAQKRDLPVPVTITEKSEYRLAVRSNLSSGEEFGFELKVPGTTLKDEDTIFELKQREVADRLEDMQRAMWNEAVDT